MQELAGHSSTITSMAINGNGVLVARADNCSLRFWNTVTLICEQIWDDKKYGLQVAFLGNDRLVNTGGEYSDRKHLFIYSIATRRSLFELRGHNGSIHCIYVLPDKNFVSGSN